MKGGIFMKNLSLFAYTFSHFGVDAVCFWILFGRFYEGRPEQELALGFIVYNFLAFGLQMVIGAYCDENRDFPPAPIGCALVFAAVPVSFLSPWAALLVCALGNAFFHIGGGTESLINSGGKLSRSGVFVSSGALGVAVGTLWGTKNVGSPLLPAILMAVCFSLCLAAQKHRGEKAETEFSGVASAKAGAGVIIVLALVSVVIRSFGGTLIPTEWKTAAELGLVSAFAAFSGKFLGGFAADIFGAKNVGVISLAASLPFIILGRNSMLISFIGILLFNMTMPITLCAVAEKMPKNPGIAFGLTTAALLMGVVPSFFAAINGNLLLFVPAVIISAVCIFFSAENKKSVSEV